MGHLHPTLGVDVRSDHDNFGVELDVPVLHESQPEFRSFMGLGKGLESSSEKEEGGEELESHVLIIPF